MKKCILTICSVLICNSLLSMGGPGYSGTQYSNFAGHHQDIGKAVALHGGNSHGKTIPINLSHSESLTGKTFHELIQTATSGGNKYILALVRSGNQQNPQRPHKIFYDGRALSRYLTKNNVDFISKQPIESIRIFVIDNPNAEFVETAVGKNLRAMKENLMDWVNAFASVQPRHKQEQIMKKAKLIKHITQAAQWYKQNAQVLKQRALFDLQYSQQLAKQAQELMQSFSSERNLPSSLIADQRLLEKIQGK